ncbi:MAG TPA: multicopper oxidase family protein [Polyangiaceae bacterium]|nr:multicopper oxidase family protein [Polyangiaceae bacterium]
MTDASRLLSISSPRSTLSSRMAPMIAAAIAAAACSSQGGTPGAPVDSGVSGGAAGGASGAAPHGGATQGSSAHGGSGNGGTGQPSGATGGVGGAGAGAAMGGFTVNRQVPDWDAELRLPSAQDSNSDPHVFETTLDARVSEIEVVPGKRTPFWSYSGVLPGPFIHVRRGDRAIIHFKNELPEPTTIHWHGLRIPSEMDGTPGHSQPEIEPGQSFTYDFVVPDAGLFWYHPHVNSAKQVGNGLYAPFLVDEEEDKNVTAKLGDELTLVLSDASISESGALEPADSGGDLGTLFGREGNTLLVNGKVQPTLKVRSGLLQRWRIVNTSRARYYQIALKEHRFRRIGGDGGRMEAPVDSDMVVVVPAERSDVLIVPVGEPGTRVPVRWVPYDRGFGTTFARPEQDLFYIEFVGDPVEPPEALPSPQRSIEALDLQGATPVEMELTQNSGTGEPLELGINGIPASRAVPLQAALGETQIWTITNPTIDFAHPFHLHGYFFQVLDEDYRPVHPLEWKDTADVPVKGTLRIGVRFDDRPGMWMYHCHLLDHADAGMMGMVEVGSEMSGHDMH